MQNWLTTNLGDGGYRGWWHIPIISLIQVTVQNLHEMAFILSINKWENWGTEKFYGLWNLTLLRGLDANYVGLLPPSTNVFIFIKELVVRQIWVQNIRLRYLSAIYLASVITAGINTPVIVSQK